MQDKITMILSPETEAYYDSVVGYLNTRLANNWKVKQFAKGTVTQDGSDLPAMEVIFET